MVSTSKILTVSYGTFSCTLEGFEDSFSTMQAIAEYFRDLAANDRYFGAEPPQPDAEMLAAIATRETARRVEAHQDGTEIVLKADDSAAALIDADAVSADAPTELPKKKKKKKKNKAKGSDKPKGKAKAVARRAAKAAAAAQSDDVVELDALDMEPAKDAAASNVEADFAAEVQDETDVLSNVLAAPEAESAEISQDEQREEAAPKAATEVPHADSDSVAAKLQRIRAVVSTENEEPDFNEDQHANDLQEAFLPGGDDLSDTFETAESVTLEDDTDALMTSEIADEDTAVDLKDLADEDEASSDDDFDMSAFTASVSNDDDDTFEEAADIDLTDDDDDADIDLSDVLGDHEDEAVEEVEAPKKIRPRVVKMKRHDFEKAVAEGTLEEDTEEAKPASMADLDGLDDIDDLVAETTSSGLSDEEEAALMADLADVEELAHEEQETATVEENRRVLLETQDTDDAAMSRLMDKTDEHMEAPDNSRRRNAIAHLKAAVAAKEAARKMGEPDDAEEETHNAFRSDLSQVVRPTRPRSSGGARASRPTPLKLVAEQRVDMIEPTKTDGTVVPRRVSLSKIATEEPMISAASDASSFAEFAEDMGATELQDLLEAAAAYTSFVEGKDVFSRPQVMNIVRTLQADEFSREDGLRSFGTLLREGRIQKIKAGRFQISEDTRFRPEDRAAS